MGGGVSLPPRYVTDDQLLVPQDDERRKPGEVITYRLTPEEVAARYGPPVKRVAGVYAPKKLSAELLTELLLDNSVAQIAAMHHTTSKVIIQMAELWGLELDEKYRLKAEPEVSGEEGPGGKEGGKKVVRGTPVTEEEKQRRKNLILRLVGERRNNKEIGKKVGLSPLTVAALRRQYAKEAPEAARLDGQQDNLPGGQGAEPPGGTAVAQVEGPPHDGDAAAKSLFDPDAFAWSYAPAKPTSYAKMGVSIKKDEIYIFAGAAEVLTAAANKGPDGSWRAALGYRPGALAIMPAPDGKGGYKVCKAGKKTTAIHINCAEFVKKNGLGGLKAEARWIKESGMLVAELQAENQAELGERKEEG